MSRYLRVPAVPRWAIVAEILSAVLSDSLIPVKMRLKMKTKTKNKHKNSNPKEGRKKKKTYEVGNPVCAMVSRRGFIE